MVRIIVGVLLEVGKGNQDRAALERLLTGEGKAKAMAPAQGLFLIGVEY
jgi:tRNA U38,U39,U40 pseudouridine synthase TruA